MVNVIGLGYIGLPTALMMAAHGVQVIGTDYNKERIARLKKGEIVFEEKGLAELFVQAQQRGIEFSHSYEKAEIYIVAVPTPYMEDTKRLDPSYVVEAVKEVLKVAPKGAIIIVESTISPGTIDRFVKPLLAGKGSKLGEDIHLVHAPERIIPGNMIYELTHNSRTIGADNTEIGERVKKMYASFCNGNIEITDIKTAEMTKVVENTFRDINIAYANELAKICRLDGMNVYEIIRIANMHPRVNILQPGPGVGGHCISVDPWFLVGDYPELANLVRMARKTNESMPQFVLKRAYDIMEKNNITDVHRVGVYGLSYKENVDDMRESPTLQLFDVMKKSLAEPLVCYDPYFRDEVVDNQLYDLDTFLGVVDMVIVMVGHNEIKNATDKLANKVVLDTRNLFTDKEIEKLYKL